MKPLVLVPQHFGCLIFDRRSSRYLPFDPPATALLTAAVRDSVFDLVGELPEPARPAAQAFVSTFYDLGLFDVSGRLCGEILDVVPPDDHLLGPLAVHLELIAACNLACSHCFAGPLPRRGQLSLPELVPLFAELASLGSFRLGLTGGEVLLRPDLFEILDEATAAGLHPCVTTNGLKIDERIARAFGERQLVWLNVSLDGATAASNDAIRGQGTFDEVLRRLRILAEHARFTLAFTVTADNHEEVAACAELARRVGAHTAVFRPLYPVGAAAQRPELMPSFADYTHALARLADQAELSAIDPFSPTHRRDRQARTHANRGCGAANLVASIASDGQVSPCSFLGPGFASGNVRDTSFREIWDQGHRFQQLRQPTDPACGGFAGGCRARAMAAHGSALAADPWNDAWLADTSGHLPPLSNVERTCEP